MNCKYNKLAEIKKRNELLIIRTMIRNQVTEFEPLLRNRPSKSTIYLSIDLFYSTIV
jgi:hypothetical protein